MKIVVGTRGSALALRQTRSVAELLGLRFSDLDVEIRIIRTEGDGRADRPLSEIGGKGVFVKELEAALQNRTIDLVVHSLKDVPAQLGPGLTLAAVLPRVDARDVLISRTGEKLSALPRGATVATGSRRRQVQLLALETRSGSPLERHAAALDDAPTRTVTTAERAFLERLGADCNVPVAAFGRLEGQRLVLDGMLAREHGVLARSRVAGAPSAARVLGRALAEELLERLTVVAVQ